jgi:hypothetical protein
LRHDPRRAVAMMTDAQIARADCATLADNERIVAAAREYFRAMRE